MNRFVYVFFMLCFWAGASAALPENMYFQAMRDEMARTQKQLQVKGLAKPFFIVYQLRKTILDVDVSAAMGVPYKHSVTAPVLVARVYMYAGNAQRNSSGFEASYQDSASSASLGDSYDAIRHGLWRLSDMQYIQAADLAEKKEAYLRQKNLPQNLAEFSSAAPAQYLRTFIPAPQTAPQMYQQWANELSAAGKELSYVEQYRVNIRLSRTEHYLLDSKGDWGQWNQPDKQVVFVARLRDKSGYRRLVQAQYELPVNEAEAEEFLREKGRSFFQTIRQTHQAQKAEPYIGPVLLKPAAAGQFFYELFVKNVRHSKRLLIESDREDRVFGIFANKVGMRVISPLFDVYDRPQADQAYGRYLSGFTPVDAEGVRAQELQLVEEGILKELPTVRSLIPGQKQSNGHARMNYEYPRAELSNVFFTPRETKTDQELEEALLTRCRMLKLPYCYIFSSFPKNQLFVGWQELLLAERIYTEDGRKEPVYGVRLDGMSVRSLRDILAAGDTEEVSVFSDEYSRLETVVIAPAILVDEVEIMPTQKEPDKAPFVAMP